MKIVLAILSKRIGVFFELLSSGIKIPVQAALSIRELLSNQLGIDPAYVDKNIQTVFLDGRAIDDIDKEIVSTGSTLALSGAMPGLVGAVLRRGGTLSPMRSNVKARKATGTSETPKGTLTLKMFNQVAADLGPLFLKNGISISGKTLGDFFCRNSEKLQNTCDFIEVNGQKYTAAKLTEIRFDQDEIELMVLPV